MLGAESTWAERWVGFSTCGRPLFFIAIVKLYVNDDDKP